MILLAIIPSTSSSRITDTAMSIIDLKISFFLCEFGLVGRSQLCCLARNLLLLGLPFAVSL
jgi:hypothetical protein